MALDENSDERAPGVQVVPSDAEETPTGIQVMDEPATGVVLAVDPTVSDELTAKDYRDKGYLVGDDIKDDEVPHLVVADQPAEPKAVVAGDAAESEADPDADKAAKRGRPRKDADKHKE